MKRIFFTTIILFIISRVSAQSYEVFMIGPMVHFNIGENKFNVSYGVECSYWNWEHFPYSVDCGMEFGGKKMRIYSEAQTGIGVMGLAYGPVLQYNFTETKLSIGTQGSIWLNYFIGTNLRLRFIDGHRVFSPGIYGKLPFSGGLYDSESNDDDWDDDWD